MVAVFLPGKGAQTEIPPQSRKIPVFALSIFREGNPASVVYTPSAFFQPFSGFSGATPPNREPAPRKPVHHPIP